MRFDPNKVELLLSKVGGSRQLGPEGIHFANLRYNSDELALLRRKLYKSGGRNPIVKFKWQELDLGTIFVFDPFAKAFFRVPALQAYAAGLSNFVHQIVLREQRERRAQKLEELAYEDCLCMINDAVNEGSNEKSARGVVRRQKWKNGQPRYATPTTSLYYRTEEDESWPTVQAELESVDSMKEELNSLLSDTDEHPQRPSATSHERGQNTARRSKSDFGQNDPSAPRKPIVTDSDSSVPDGYPTEIPEL